eukprot:Lankesteria_metandrocarpae@DN5408_c0_g1_i2.p1
MHSWIHEKMASGVIERAPTPPLFLAPHFCAGPKQERVVGDFRELNNLTIPLRDLTMYIDAIRAWSARQAFLMKLDLAAGFHNVPVEHSCRSLLGFVGPDGFVYRYIRMPMGVRNGPAVFCRWLGSRLAGIVPSHSIRIYQDDIFISGGSIAERALNLSRVEKVLRVHSLAINPRKTEFGETGMNVLGVELRNGTYRLSETALRTTVAAILAVTTATTATKRQLYKVVGKVNFYRTLGADVQQLLQPVYAYTRQLTDWNTPHTTPRPVRDALVHVAGVLPNWSTSVTAAERHISIYTDASDTGLGAAVIDDNGNVLRRWSAQHKVANFDAAQKELTALYVFLKANAPFLHEYADIPWRMYMDNLPAICYMNRSTVPPDAVKANIVAKIFNCIREYKSEVSYHHVAGVANVEADVLSRRS